MSIKLKTQNRDVCSADLLRRRGQSLIEILIALGIGALLIGAATVSIVFVVRSSSTNSRSELANRLNQDLLNKVQTVAAARFNDIFLLDKGSSSPYFIYASGSILLVSSGTEGIANDAPVSGLLGTWGLDEATGTLSFDSSGNGNHGTIISKVARVTSTCQIAYCIQIPGEDYIQANVAGSPVLTSFSLTAWSRLDTGEDGGIHSIRAGGDGSGLGVATNGRPGGRVINNGSVRLNLSAPSGVTVTDNRWHHLVLTFDGSSRKGVLYVDSVERASGTAGSGITGATDYTRIGKDMDNYWSNWDGEIDEVRLYNRALSAAEVHQLWNSAAYQRYFYVENTCRSKTLGTNTGVHTCNPATEFVDPSTVRVTNLTRWSYLGGSGQLILPHYLTRWKNEVFRQNDWSAGAGQAGPYTSPGTGYSSSSNINASTTGVIRIEGL